MANSAITDLEQERQKRSRDIDAFGRNLITIERDLSYGGGGPTGGDMLEQRVKHLEDDIKEVKSDLKILRSDVAELTGRVSMLPGYGGIALIVGLMVGLSTAAQIAARFLQAGG